MIGITCSFHDVNNYINLPIKYIQILFMTREDGPITVPITEIIQLKNKLTKIVEITNQKILIENSASKKCFGTTLNELLEYIKNYSNIGICLDTAHAYFAGIDLVQFNRDLHHPKVELIHLNGIHPELKYG